MTSLPAPPGYRQYQARELVEMLVSGQSATIRDMAGRWRELHRGLAERAESLKAGLDRLEAAWEGEAAETYLSRMRELESTMRVGAEAAKANWNALEDAATSLERAQGDTPVMKPMPTGGDADGEHPFVPDDRGKEVLVERLNQVDAGYYDANDRLRTVPYEGPPPADAPDDGADDGTEGETELAGSAPVAPRGGTPVGAVVGGDGPGPGGAGASGRLGTVGPVAAERGAPTASTQGAGRPMPMGMGGARGGAGGGDDNRKTWLMETDDVWGAGEEAAPRVLGQDPDDRRRRR